MAVRCEFLSGTDITEAAVVMVGIASDMHCHVYTSFNKVVLEAVPDKTLPSQIVKRYHQLLDGKKPR